ncbi:hypothetical protein HPB52_025633 [Rhipicephalus sanguineus]|uniref:Uncharacterized protein n=2 Tax=Rhipicephalus sanguineus TaxID=34632 RepID=A0A9D4PB66_RHISA|nr:hypothetical protein HPB52_025633 [Rhipicephalus sanguineus]
MTAPPPRVSSQQPLLQMVTAGCPAVRIKTEPKSPVMLHHSAALFFHGSHDASLDEPPHAKVNSDNIPRFHGNSGSSASRYGNNSSNDRSPPATMPVAVAAPTTASHW